MHIYFVNQYSKIVGPFDITDSNHQKNIRNGDVIIRDTCDGLCFLIVTSSINKWNRCKCIDTVQGHLKREGNFLLFSFDGISKRFGDIQALSELSQLFQNPPCHDFFENALSILTYKCDLWDISIFKDIHSLTPFKIYNDNADKSIVIDKKTYSQYLFEDYFDTIHYINWDEVEEQEAAEEALCSSIINDLKSRDGKILSLQKEWD